MNYGVRYYVMQFLEKQGKATSVEVFEAVKEHGFSIQQVRTCLANGVTDRFIASSGRVAKTGVNGSAPASYWVLPKDGRRYGRRKPVDKNDDAALFRPNRHDRYEKKPRYASVWAYAQGQAINQAPTAAE